MSDKIQATCSSCGAKYRLPVEYAGRTARCKKCGTKFAVPAEHTLEDSVIDWLRDADDEEAVAKPRVIDVPKSDTPEPTPRRPGMPKPRAAADAPAKP